MEVMNPRVAVAVAWIIAAAKETDRQRRKTLRSINGVYNPGIRGALICTAAEQAGQLYGYKDALSLLNKAGLVPEDLWQEVQGVLKV